MPSQCGCRHIFKGSLPKGENITLHFVVQDLSCSDYAALVSSYNGSSAAVADCSGNLKRLAIAQKQYNVPFAPSSLVMNDPAFVGAHSCTWFPPQPEPTLDLRRQLRVSSSVVNPSPGRL